MELREVINKRTSVRSYKNTPVTQEQLDILLKSAVRAPNGCNYQSWHYYAVCDKEMIDAINPDIAHIPWIKDISLVIVVCILEKGASLLKSKFGERGVMFAVQETAAAIENILLTAVDLGLGGCWIGPMNVEKCKTHLSIADNHNPLAILTIGTPSAETPPRDRKPLEQVTTIIGKLPKSSEKSEEIVEKPFSLEHASLPNAVFDDLNLANAIFNNINLSGAKFSDINMSETTYSGLTMAGAEFGCVELVKARFENPDFNEAEFVNCSMKNVKLENCDITGMTIDGISVAKAIEKIKSDK